MTQNIDKPSVDQYNSRSAPLSNIKLTFRYDIPPQAPTFYATVGNYKSPAARAGL